MNGTELIAVTITALITGAIVLTVLGDMYSDYCDYVARKRSGF